MGEKHQRRTGITGHYVFFALDAGDSESANGEVVSNRPWLAWNNSKVASSALPVNGKLTLRKEELNSLLHKPLINNLPSSKPISEMDIKLNGLPCRSFLVASGGLSTAVEEKFTFLSETALKLVVGRECKQTLGAVATFYGDV